MKDSSSSKTLFPLKTQENFEAKFSFHLFKMKTKIQPHTLDVNLRVIILKYNGDNFGLFLKIIQFMKCMIIFQFVASYLV